jgi:hypothetical protein
MSLNTLEDIKSYKLIEHQIKMKHKLREWGKVLSEIEAEKDFRVLMKKYNMKDNFTLFPNMSSDQKIIWEQWLFQYPQKGTSESFEETFRMFGVYDFLINNTICIRYNPKKEMQHDFLEEIEPVEGEYLGFHPIGGVSLEQQTLTMRTSVELVSKKLIELRTYFVCQRPFSDYRP